MEPAVTVNERREELTERLFAGALGALDLLCVYVGDQLGLYGKLDELGTATSTELARAASLDERYTREWLEQQTLAGIVETDEPQAADLDRRYAIPTGHDDVLMERGGLDTMTPIAQLVVACALPIHAVLDAFRTGDGVPYAAYGSDLHEGQANFTRPLFDTLLASEWLPAVPDIHDRLRADPPARVADVACGLGRSSIAIARGYPLVTVDGLDLDAASIERAQAALPGSGVDDRVTFHHRDTADPALAGRYDLVTIFEALHDMGRPVDVLRSVRGLLAEGGCVLVGDERTADRFSLDAGDVERLYYGFSVLHCLPVGMVGDDPAGTGTVIRADTVRDYGREAGFASIDIAPIENDFWRFYVLRP